MSDSAMLGLRDVVWMCEQRPFPKSWREPIDRRGGSAELPMPDGSLVCVSHDAPPLLTMGMSLAIYQAARSELLNQLRKVS